MTETEKDTPSKVPNETELEVIGETPTPSTEDDLIRENLRFYQKWKRATVLKYAGLLTFGFGIMGLGLAVLWWGSSEGWLLDFFRWLKGAGMKGRLIVALIMIPTNFPFIVGYAMITLASGFLFGFWWGLFTVVVGAQLGILAVNLVVRNFLKERTEQWIEKSGGRYANAIMKEIAINRAKVCFFLRLLPMPIGLQNCMLSVSPIPLWMYQLCSGAGLLVKQIPEVYVGTTLNDVADIIQGDGEFNPAELIPIIVGFVAVIIFAIMILVFSRKVMARLKEMEEEELDAVAEEVEDGLVAVELEEDSAPASPNPSDADPKTTVAPPDSSKEVDVVEVNIDELEKKENDVALSTMHSSDDVEWKKSQADQEEERNHTEYPHEEDIDMTPLPLEN